MVKELMNLLAFAASNSKHSINKKLVIHARVYQDKPMIMLSTSPGSRGGANVLATALASAARFGGDVKASLSVPGFHTNFDIENGKLKTSELLVTRYEIS